MSSNDVKGEIITLEKGHKYSIRFRIPPSSKNPKWTWSPKKKVYGNKIKANAELIKYHNEYFNSPNDNLNTLKNYITHFEKTRKTLGKVKETTIKRDEPIVKRIIEYLGTYELKELNTQIIEKTYIKMAKAGESANIIHNVHSKLKKVLQKAVYEQRIIINPCNAIDGITRPKAHNEDKLFSDKQFKTLLNAIKKEKPSSFITVLWLAISTGMRKGEILGLLWENVDLKNNKIRVKYQYGHEKKLVKPKTDGSNRTITIDKATSKYLKEWQKNQKSQFKNTDVKIYDKTPVCTNELGGFINPDNFGRWRRQYFYSIGIATYDKTEKFQDKAGRTRTKNIGYHGPDLHALRKKHTEILVAQNVDPKTVQARLGHERISTTLEIYAQAVPRNEEKSAEIIGKFMI